MATVTEINSSDQNSSTDGNSAAESRRARGRKGGAPSHNTNALKHGLRSTRGRRLLLLGGVAKGNGWIKRALEGLRAAWESGVVEKKGKLSTDDEATLTTALRWERHALLATAWLRRSEADLQPLQRLEFSKAIAEASEKRDAALRRLGLGDSGAGATAGDSPWSALDELADERRAAQ